MPRLFRESPLLGIWEGSGNVICLDVLRAVAQSPETLDVIIGELKQMQGKNRIYDAHLARIEKSVAAIKAGFAKAKAKAKSASTGKRATKQEQVNAFADEAGARSFVEMLALALQAKVMIEQAEPARANAFIRARLASGALAFGNLAVSKSGRGSASMLQNIVEAAFGA